MSGSENGAKVVTMLNPLGINTLAWSGGSETLLYSDVFEEDGIITSSPSPTDRRSQIVSLTEKGRQFTQEVLAALYDMEERSFACFTDRELSRYVNGNRQLAAAIRQEVEEDLKHAQQ